MKTVHINNKFLTDTRCPINTIKWLILVDLIKKPDMDKYYTFDEKDIIPGVKYYEWGASDFYLKDEGNCTRPDCLHDKCRIQPDIKNYVHGCIYVRSKKQIVQKLTEYGIGKPYFNSADSEMWTTERIKNYYMRIMGLGDEKKHKLCSKYAELVEDSKLKKNEILFEREGVLRYKFILE
jgi:hypothetical protein